MIEENATDAAKIHSRRFDVAPKMPRDEAVDEICEPVQDKQPGEKEMPAPALGKRLVARQRQPIRECASRQIAVRIGEDAENARGVDFGAADLHPADGRSFEALFGVNREDRRIAFVAGIAPIETRVRIEDLETAHQQDRDAEHVQPVREADKKRMAINQLAAGAGSPRRLAVHLLRDFSGHRLTVISPPQTARSRAWPAYRPSCRALLS